MTDNNVHNQPNNGIEGWVYMIMLLTIGIGYLVTAFVEREFKLFRKGSSGIVVPLPFIVLVVIMVPLMLIEPEIEMNIIIYAASFPTLFLFGFSTAIFLQRGEAWKKRKLEKARKARGDFRKKTKR